MCSGLISLFGIRLVQLAIQSALAKKANILPLQTNLPRELVMFAGSTVSVKPGWHRLSFSPSSHSLDLTRGISLSGSQCALNPRGKALNSFVQLYLCFSVFNSISQEGSAHSAVPLSQLGLWLWIEL